MADPILYTLALEYHHKPAKYDGPPYQLVPRKYFAVTNMTPNTMTSKSNDTSVTITKIGPSSWDGLCVVQVYPEEQSPVHFTIQILTNVHSSGIQLVLRSCLLTSINANNFNGGIDASSIGESTKGTVAITNDEITTTIGRKTFHTTRKDDGIYLCVYLFHNTNSVVITIEK